MSWSSRRWATFRLFARYSTARSHTWVLRCQIRLLTRPSDGADMSLCDGAACGARNTQAHCRAVAVRQHAHGGTRGAPQRDSDRSAHRCHALRRDKDLGAARVVRAHSGPPRAVRLSRAAGCLCAASSKHTVTTVKGGHVHEGAGVAGGGLSAHLRCLESRHTRRSHREQLPSAQHAALHHLVGSRLANAPSG